MQNLWTDLEKKGFSTEVVKTIQQGWRPATKKQYNTYIKKWQHFCEQWSINQINSSIIHVLNFLGDMSEHNYSYSSINTAKSALLAVVKINDSKDWGNHPELIRFMKGVFNTKTPIPRYSNTWDPDVVLKYIKSLWPLQSLTLKELTFRTVTLIALVSGQRAQSIHFMDIKNMSSSNDKYVFVFDKPLKNSKPGSSLPILEIRMFLEDNSLCAYTSLKAYLQRTESKRKNTQLWVSFTKPYNPVGRQSISRWLKNVLSSAGIDTNIFKAHSTRMAATSKASHLGVGLTCIIKTAGWKSSTNFEKFYLREQQQPNTEFTTAVLSLKN